MIPSEIAALRALAEKATPGQWTVGASSHEIDVPDGEDGLFSVATAELPEDAALIASAPADLRYLLDALKEARAERDAAIAERDARPDIRTLPTEFVAGEWILSGLAEPDAIVTYASTPSPETGDIGWCWWARGKMGSRRYYMDARAAAERALRAHGSGE